MFWAVHFVPTQRGESPRPVATAHTCSSKLILPPNFVAILRGESPQPVATLFPCSSGLFLPPNFVTIVWGESPRWVATEFPGEIDAVWQVVETGRKKNIFVFRVPLIRPRKRKTIRAWLLPCRPQAERLPNPAR
jgi:hypothetical protein